MKKLRFRDEASAARVINHTLKRLVYPLFVGHLRPQWPTQPQTLITRSFTLVVPAIDNQHSRCFLFEQLVIAFCGCSVLVFFSVITYKPDSLMLIVFLYKI